MGKVEMRGLFEVPIKMHSSSTELAVPPSVPPAQVEDGRPVRDDVRRPEGGRGFRTCPPHRQKGEVERQKCC